MEIAYFSIFPLLLTSYSLMWYHPIGSFILFVFALVQCSSALLRSLKISSLGKGVLITGCDTGFGHELALSLRKAGFTVFACCLDDESEGGKKLASIDADEKIHVIKMDVRKQEQVDNALNYVENHLPKSGLWGLVNNAGVGGSGFFEWMSMDQFEKMAAVNLFGTIRVTKAFVPLVRESKGRIVNVSSALGRSTVIGSSAYCVTKHGIEGFSNVLRKEMRQFGVKVCTIEPGNFLNTTGIIGGIDGALRAINQNWNNLSASLQETYGRKSFEDSIALHKGMIRLSAKDTAPVVNAMVECICQLYPKTHYLVGSLVEKTLVHLNELLPAFIMDSLLPLMKMGIKAFDK